MEKEKERVFKENKEKEKKRETKHGLTMVIYDYPDKLMTEREKTPWTPA